jgi:hypothetical protein
MSLRFPVSLIHYYMEREKVLSSFTPRSFMNVSTSHPLYLWLDSKSEYYPNPTAGIRSRSRRATTYCFQTVGCDYFVDVTILYTEELEATRHDVKIKIMDFACETEDGQPKTIKQQNFLPDDGTGPASHAAIRRLAHLHLLGYEGSVQY